MSFTGVGSQYHSISHSGLSIFDKEKISTGIGSVTIDLASAPIPPGEYTMHVGSGVGGVEIYIPNYVQFTIDGSSVIGGTTVHEGLGFWKTLARKFATTLNLPTEMPKFVADPVDLDNPVMIHFNIDIGVGGVDIYRLAPDED